MTTARERLEAANDLGHPQGAYTVELNDATTGRRLELIELPNYVSGAYARSVKWWQGAHFHRGPALQAVQDGLANGGAIGTNVTTDYLAPPRLNAHGVILTDSAIAEDSASEWGTGRTIAYGTRWKSTIPASGKRGQINEAQSALQDDVVKLVWDFNETQGNGTFRSLNLASFDTYGNLLTPPTGYYYTYDQVDTGSTNYFGLYASGMNTAGTVAYGVTNEATTVALYSIPLTGGTDNGDYYQADAPTKVCTLAGLGYTSYSSSNINYVYYSGASVAVSPIGADYLVCWATYLGGVHVGRYTAAGVEVWKVTALAAATGRGFGTGPSITNDGTYAYITTGYNENSTRNHVVHRFNLGTQAIDATYTMGAGYPTAVAYDGTDLLVGINGTTDTNGIEQSGIYRITTGGSHIEYYGNPYESTTAIATVAPWPGVNGYLNSQAAARDYDVYNYAAPGYYALSMGGTGLGTAARQRAAGYKLLAGNGKLFLCSDGYTVGGQGKYALHQLGGSNIYSRTVLGANQAKSSSQTMQITYELTLPSEWRGRPAHVAPPT